MQSLCLFVHSFREKKQATLTFKKSSLEKDRQQKIFITTAFVTRDQFFCILIKEIFNTKETSLIERFLILTKLYIYT